MSMALGDIMSNIKELIKELQVPSMEPYEILRKNLKKVPEQEQNMFNILGQVLINEYSEPINIFTGEGGFLLLNTEEAMDIVKKECVIRLINTFQYPTEDPFLELGNLLKEMPSEFKELIQSIGLFFIQHYMEPVNAPKDLRAILPISEEEAMKKVNEIFFKA